MSQTEFLGLLIIGLSTIGGFLLTFLKLKSTIEKSILDQLNQKQNLDDKDYENISTLTNLKISYLEKEIKANKEKFETDLNLIKQSTESLRHEIMEQHKYLNKLLSNLLKEK